MDEIEQEQLAGRPVENYAKSSAQNQENAAATVNHIRNNGATGAYASFAGNTADAL